MCVCVFLKMLAVNEFVWCCRCRTVTIVCARRRRIIWYCYGNRFANNCFHFSFWLLLFSLVVTFFFFSFRRMCCRCCCFFVIILVLSNRLTCVHMLKTPYSAEMEFVTSESNLCPKIMFVVLQFFSISSRCIPIFCFVHLFHSLTPSFLCNFYTYCVYESEAEREKESGRERQSHLINACDVRDVRSTIFHYIVCYGTKPEIGKL